MIGYVLDTNVIIRYLIADNEELYKQASIIFARIKSNEVKALLIGEVLAETVFVLESVYQVPKEKIADKLIELITCYQGVQADKYLLNALLLFKIENVHIVDCLVIVKSRSINAFPLSFDKKLLKLI